MVVELADLAPARLPCMVPTDRYGTSQPASQPGSKQAHCMRMYIHTLLHLFVLFKDTAHTGHRK